MLNLNFLFREPKLYSQPGQRVLLAMIKVESENECRFQNMPYDWKWGRSREKGECDRKLALPLSIFMTLECIIIQNFFEF